MASTAAVPSPPPPTGGAGEISLFRLCILRAAYLLLVVGLGAMIVPGILSHEPASRGVIPSLLGAIWLLAWLGLRYPLEMLPLLIFELAWKLIWMIAYGLPQYWAGRLPPTFAEDFLNIGFGVILMPLVIPWGYVWRRFVTPAGTPWTPAKPR